MTTLFAVRSGGAAPPKSTTVKSPGSMRPSAVATNETWVAPLAAARTTDAASNPGSTVSGVPVASALVTTDKPPMWARGRQANQW